jgi:collagen type III alpha
VASPGPAFGPGAAKFASSGSARVPAPESGGLPQRTPPANQETSGAPESAWAPPPSAQPAAAEENPFARQSEPAHPYRAGGSELPQRSPGIAGGPLDGPVGEFNGFTPTRQPADSAPGAGPGRTPGSPFDRPQFGAAADPFGGDRSAPAPREPLGGAMPAFGSARSDDDPQPDRPPGVSAFGDQRVRVPGATLTGLPDAAPATPDSGSFPTRGESGPPAAGGGLPTRGTSESGGFPIRGGSGNGSFPIRGAGAAARAGDAFTRPDTEHDPFPAQDAGSGGFSARDAGSGAFPARGEDPRGEGDNQQAARTDVDSDGFPARPGSDSNPFRDGSFRREGADGGFPASGTSDSGGFSMGNSDDEHGQARPGRPVSGQPDDLPARRGFGDRPDDADQRSDGPGGSGYAQRIPGASFASAGPPDADRPEAGNAGYAQRVPGASFGSSGSPAVAEPRAAAAVPQPRDPAERPESGDPSGPAERPGPAKGTARPVSASASVPVASRVTPPADAEEVPPPATASPQPRVYGRATPAAEPTPQQEQDQPVSGAHGQAADSLESFYGRPPKPANEIYGRPPEAPFGTRPSSGGAPQSPFDSQPGGSQYPEADRPPFDGGQPDRAPFDGAQAAGPQFGGQQFGSPFDGAQPGSQPDRPPFDGAQPGGQPGSFGTAPSSGAPDSAPTSGAYGAAPTSGAYGAAPTSGSYGTGTAPTSGAFGTAPTSGDGRPAGRASASARVTPPPPGQPFAPGSPAPGQSPEARDAAAFSEFTTDISGRGRSAQPEQPGPVPGNPAARTMPPDQYSEHTTDVSGRGPGSDPYVPAPALPSMHAAPPLENGFPPAPGPDSTQPFGERPRMGGVFPGPASRATVTPPGPEQTASWPNRAEPDEDQGRFDSFKQDSPEVVPTEVAKPETPHVRMLPVILGVILGAALIVGLTLGVTWLIARGSHDGGTGFSVSAGDCVKQQGNEAVTANCSDPGSFEVTAIVDTKEQCPDPNQPYVVNPADNGRTQVLCLKPKS